MNSGSINTLGLLGVVFITLKLCKVISWSWWLVLLPFYGVFAILIVLLLLYILGYVFFNRH